MNFVFVNGISNKILLDSSPKYTAPEVFLNPSPSGVKVDSWSLGIIIAEKLLEQSIWPGVKLSQCLRKVLSLMLCDISIFECLAREHNCFHIYKVSELVPVYFNLFALFCDVKYLLASCRNYRTS